MQKAEASTWKQRAKHPPNLGKAQTQQKRFHGTSRSEVIGLIFANLALLAHSLRNYVLPAKTVSMSMSMCQCVSQNRHCAQLPGCPMGKKITCECHYSAESPGQHMVITGRNLPPINTNDKKSGKPNPETEAFVKFS